MIPSYYNPPKVDDYFESSNGFPLTFVGFPEIKDEIYRVKTVDLYEYQVYFTINDKWFKAEFRDINILTVEEARERMIAAWRNSGTKQQALTAQNLSQALPKAYQIPGKAIFPKAI